MKKKIFANILMISMLFAGCANPVSNTDSILSQDTEQIDTTISDTQTIDMENATEQTPYGISITELTEDTTYYSKTDPSVQVLNGSASYPEISIADHADIEKKINDVMMRYSQSYSNNMIIPMVQHMATSGAMESHLM